jgi:hypothetical protein
LAQEFSAKKDQTQYQEPEQQKDFILSKKKLYGKAAEKLLSSSLMDMERCSSF